MTGREYGASPRSKPPRAAIHAWTAATTTIETAAGAARASDVAASRPDSVTGVPGNRSGSASQRLRPATQAAATIVPTQSHTHAVLMP